MAKSRQQFRFDLEDGPGKDDLGLWPYIDLTVNVVGMFWLADSLLRAYKSSKQGVQREKILRKVDQAFVEVEDVSSEALTDLARRYG